MPPARFGQILREARERRGLSIAQLSRQTTIPIGDIEALEAGALDALPQAMYRRAEARAYAEAVGLDPAVVLTQLRSASEPAPTSQPAATSEAILPSPHSSPVPPQPTTNDAARIGRALILLAIGCGALMWDQRSRHVTDEPLTSFMTMPAVDAASLIEEAVRIAEPPTPPPTLRRVLYEPRIAANGQRWPRNGRLDEGVLVVHSTPRGARVTVNGVGWGQTPVAVRYLPLGTVRVRVGKADYGVQERIVQLTPEQPGATLNVTLRQLPRRQATRSTASSTALVITSVPDGARVTVNGVGWGTTPVSIPYLRPGVQRVRLVKDHFRSEERAVTVGEGNTGHVALTLKPVS